MQPLVKRRRISSTASRIPKGTFSLLGTGLGALAGAKFGNVKGGAVLGGMLGQGLSAVTGYGDYTGITGNRMSVPKVFNKIGRNGVCIRHEEYLGDIVTSSTPGAFSIQGFYINPGQGTTFPWLEQIAVNFEEYILQGCLFTFKSMSADALNSTNTALGTVIMATDYNAGNPLFASKAEMESYEFASSCKPSLSMVHPIECHPHQNPISELYVRPGALPSGQDVRLYDLGLFQIATTGFQAASVNIGELWISYQVCLLKPKMWQALGYNTGYYNVINSTGVAAATPLGTAGSQVAQTGNNLAVTQTATVLTLPQTSYPQAYRVILRWVGSVGAAITYPIPTFTNCAQVGVSYTAPNAGIPNTTQCLLEFTVLTNGLYQQPSITIGVAGTIPTGTTVCGVSILQVPNTANSE